MPFTVYVNLILYLSLEKQDYLKVNTNIARCLKLLINNYS